MNIFHICIWSSKNNYNQYSYSVTNTFDIHIQLAVNILNMNIFHIHIRWYFVLQLYSYLYSTKNLILVLHWPFEVHGQNAQIVFCSVCAVLISQPPSPCKNWFLKTNHGPRFLRNTIIGWGLVWDAMPKTYFANISTRVSPFSGLFLHWNRKIVMVALSTIKGTKKSKTRSQIHSIMYIFKIKRVIVIFCLSMWCKISI